jgi:uncharacterized membrane protein
MASAKDFFSEAEQEAIVNAIRAAELHTSGEIRVHADNRCDGDAFKRAQIVFHSLQMDRKPFKNSVLIYVAVKDKKFALIGDEAIHTKVGDSYWKNISQAMQSQFKEGNFTLGIIEAIQTIGQTLAKYFPDIDELDKNTLPDDISFE